MRALALASLGIPATATAQITLQQDFVNKTSAAIGTYQGINFREGGFSGLYPIQGTNGKEFWVISDRGVNIDGANANTSACRPTYDKIFVFPNYAPKIHRIRLNGDSVQILRTITMKRPDNTTATGVLNPTGLGSTATEQASTDTVNDCNNFSSKIANKDIWSIDAEAIVVDKDGNFWISEENGPTIWKLNQNGVVVNRYTPYGNLANKQSQDIAIDTVFRYRKNNRGFENLAITPGGKLYAVIQSPIQFPTQAIGDASRIHRILELDPATGVMRQFAYVNDGVIGAAGANQIRTGDWKLGDIAAVNDSTFLVLEAAARGTSDFKRMYQININGATPVTSGLYGGNSLEGLVDSAGMAAQGLVPVRKTLAMDLLANGWPKALDKAEGLAILNDSTIFITNDNDFGQSSAAANGIATATGNLSHVIRYGLSGTNKLRNFRQLQPTLTAGITGPSTAQGPYLVASQPGVQITSIMSVGDVFNGYRFVGIPDGLGAFDNNDGTFTLLVNHEFGNTSGAVHKYGANGAFVSKWVINKSDLNVVSGTDLDSVVKLWNPATSSYVAYNRNFLAPNSGLNFGRHCSADLPAVTAYYNPKTGKGTQSRIFMNGEETGNEGRGLAHVATGPEAGTIYEIPRLGKYSYENAVASPRISDTTIVVGLDDATPGQVYFYMGTKQSTGNEIEKAGLTNGSLWSVAVSGMLTETSASIPAAGTAFSMINLGNVENMTGGTLQTNSNNNGVTQFLRPEDGTWDPQHPEDFYFNTTNSFGSPSRTWRLRFSDPGNITRGGTITAVLDGTEGQQMLDNICIDNGGHLIHVEDVGGNAHLGRMFQYDIAADTLIQLAVHDATRFLNGSANFLTQDEEATGQIDAQAILGPGMFLVSDQAHYGISGDMVEGGQLMAFYNPATAAANPEVNLKGNNISIQNNDLTPSPADSTDFGRVDRGTTAIRSYVIENAGPGALNVRELTIEGANASSFSLVGAPAVPFTIAAGAARTVQVRFTANVDSVRNATLNFVSNDLNEDYYTVALRAQGVSPDINLTGNGETIASGDLTPGTSNNTDFGITNIGAAISRSFVIQNTGLGTLKIDSMRFSGANAAEFSVTGATFPMTIAAAGVQTVNVQFAPTSGGLRTATLAAYSNDADEATYSFSVQGRGIERVGVNNVNTSSIVKLFPNPTGGNATIAMNLKKEDRIIINVLNLEGKQVVAAIDQRYGAGDQNITLPTANLANGTYFVEVATGTQTLRMQLVVLH
jgi:hypothetical protein